MKHHLLLLILPLCAVTASDTPTLGLAERRAIKTFQDSKLPALQEALVAAAGKPVEIQIDWEKIAVVGESDRYAEDGYWVNVFFLPTTNALSSITADEMGKEALGAKLTRIVFTFDEDTAPASNYPNGVSFEEGVLTLNFRPGSNEGDITPRMEAIVSTLEPKL
jgi:hypothetical protein